MTAIPGQLGGAQIGVNLMLGGPPPGGLRTGTGVQPQASTFLANTALPFIAHLHSTTMAFKGSLGPLLSRPKLKWAYNSRGYNPITAE